MLQSWEDLPVYHGEQYQKDSSSTGLTVTTIILVVIWQPRQAWI